MTTKRRLTRIDPLRAGIVLSILYGIPGLIVGPTFLLVALAGRGLAVNGIELLLGVMIALVVYAVAGFIGGIIAAALYNLVAKLTGGLKLEVIDDTIVA